MARRETAAVRHFCLLLVLYKIHKEAEWSQQTSYNINFCAKVYRCRNL